jgi:peptidoglycan/LPS O-acetylase OafA/YrhL
MKLKYIDALRGLAIMGVLIVHCGQHGRNEGLPTVIQSIILNGAHGVQLFYVASAFTLFLTLANRRAPEKYPWFNFFIRRFFRIAPMYYLGICYYLWQDGFGARYWLGDADRITTFNILSNFFFVHGFNPYWITSLVPGGWSIAVEMFFYCLIPLLFLKIRTAQQAFLFVLITLFARALLQFLFNRFPLIGHERLWIEYLYMYFPSQLPVFALGILFYFVVKDDYRLSVSPMVILVSFFILIAQFVGVPLLPNHFLFSIAFVVLAVALSKYEFKLFVNPIFIYIGKVSYSMYLVHFAVLFWLDHFNFVDFLQITDPFHAMMNYGIRLFVLTILTVAISSFFYRTIELPLQHIGRKLIYKINNRSSPAFVTADLPVATGRSAVPVLPDTISNDNSSDHSVKIPNEK